MGIKQPAFQIVSHSTSHQHRRQAQALHGGSLARPRQSTTPLLKLKDFRVLSQTRVQMAERSSTVHLQEDDAIGDTSESVCNAFTGMRINSVDQAAVNLLSELSGHAEESDLTSAPNSRAEPDATEEYTLTAVTQPDTVTSDIEVSRLPDVSDYKEVPPPDVVPEIPPESDLTLLQDATAVFRSSSTQDVTVNNSTTVQDTSGAAVMESTADKDVTAVPHPAEVPQSVPSPAAASKSLPPVVIRRVAPRPAPSPRTPLAPDPVPEVYSGWVPRPSLQRRGDRRPQFLRNTTEMFPLFVMPLSSEMHSSPSITPAHSLLVPEELPIEELPESPLQGLSVHEFVREILYLISDYSEE